MNNAKMTFRFDHGRKQSSERSAKESPKVIPLHSEEYKVVGRDRLPGDLAFGDIDPVDSVNDRDREAREAYDHPLIDAQPLNQYTYDFGGWQSSFDTETQRVERLIRESSAVSHEAETAYKEQRERPDTRYFHNDQDQPLKDHRWYVPEETIYVARSSNSSWLKVTASVAGAVITGVAFGFFVLSMFSGQTQGNTANTATTPGPSASAGSISVPTSGDKGASGNPQAVPASAAVATSASVSASASASTAVAAAAVPAKSYSFLQSGIFSTAQAADAAQAELKKKGIAAVSDTGEKYPVYTAMALTREEASELAKKLQQQKTDVIVKNVELPALNKIKWSANSPEALSSYIAQGDKVLQLIAPLTLSHLSEAKPSAIGAETLKSVKTGQQAWSALEAGAKEGLGDDARGAVQKMGNALNQAVLSLDEYNKNPNPARLWDTQGALMQYVLAQKELRKSAAAQ